MEMWKDPIVEEVRTVREAYAKRFDYDVKAICRDLRRRFDHFPVISVIQRQLDQQPHGEQDD